MFFKTGKPKRKYMLCRDNSYLSEVRKINGYININWVCGGNRCPLYGHCDDRGGDWR